ncbi:MAG TPA: hypothetical protein DDZ88_28340 [Verrucomicrobiales bacterium]|nr:hypothetical protein [Verrucomicrobiales bacterium]
MSTITAILEPQADGTLHLPLPANLRSGRVRVIASLTVDEESKPSGSQETPLQALKELRKLGGLRHVIPDPMGWQKEQRQERQLPGHD